MGHKIVQQQIPLVAYRVAFGRSLMHTRHSSNDTRALQKVLRIDKGLEDRQLDCHTLYHLVEIHAHFDE